MRLLRLAVTAVALTSALILGPCINHAIAQSGVPANLGTLVYVSPMPAATSASAATTITIRGAEAVDPASVNASLFTVGGSVSGNHLGDTILARDGKTVIFKPATAFIPGETVQVSLRAGLRTTSAQTIPAAQWQFTVSPKPYPYATIEAETIDRAVYNLAGRATLNQQIQPTAATALSVTQVFTTPKYVTVPNFPIQVTVTQTTGLLSDGFLFWAPFSVANPSLPPYLTIFDNNANLVYYQAVPGNGSDFKRHPNGLLSYFEGSANRYVIVDSNYNRVDTLTAGNGYVTDLHELQLLPNGHALLMIYDRQPLDLTSLGGRADATVIDLVLQELDQDKNVVFQWNSRDHIAITDTFAPLAAQVVDYVHGNAIELDTDGNLLISSRHLSEITKIDRSTGAILWRLGGKNNQFTFVGDTTLPNVGGFSFQHDIRRLPNGHITLFDNGNQFMDAGLRNSRGVEYTLDETAKTATLVREFRTTPDIVSLFMGNMQRLPNGNTMIGWGGGVLGSNPKPPDQALTEFNSEGEIALSASFLNDPYVSYRAFRFPWQGFPTTSPALVAVTTTNPISLYYSWNGATEVVSYTVAGGSTPDWLVPFATQPKTGFEDSTTVAGAPANSCFFQVTPTDKQGAQNRASAVLYLGDAACPTAETVQATGAASVDFAVTGDRGPVTVTVAIEAGTLTTSTIVVVTPNPAFGQPPPTGLIAGGPIFNLSTHEESSLAASAGVRQASLAKPLVLTVDYSAAQAPHPLGLRLIRWDAATQSWTEAGVTLLANDTVGRKLTVQVAETGVFALVTTNQAPTSTGAAWVVTSEDTTYAFKPADFPYTDADGDPLAGVTVVSLPITGAVTLAGNPVATGAVIPAANLGQLAYVPPANANGAPLASFAYSISDGFVAAGPYTATIQVLPVNDAPVAVDDVEPVAAAGTSAENAGSPQFKATVVVEVLGNDYDIDGDRLTITNITAPAHGTVAKFGDAIQYTPNSSFTGSDEFTYTIADGNGGTATAKVRIADLADTLFIPLIKNSAR